MSFNDEKRGTSYHRLSVGNKDMRDDEKKGPPYSRIFVVCSKDVREDDLRQPFEQFGEIEDIYMPKNRNTGESKGFAYLKYMKTSSAAAAIRDLHQKTLKSSGKPIKVMVATNKHENEEDINVEKLNRLFIKIPKQATESELKQYFSEFGHVESVYIQKDRQTDESKGLAYIQFADFFQTAKAYEECDKKYKAVFATPKQDMRRNRDNFDLNDSFHSVNSNTRTNDYYNYRDNFDYEPRDNLMVRNSNVSSLLNTPATAQEYKTLLVGCSPAVPQRYIEKLFNIIPGMLHCQFTMDSFNNCCKAEITYEDNRAAAHALEKLNHFDFPSGEVIFVKPKDLLKRAANELTSIVNSFKSAVDAGSPDLVQLADAIAQASTLIKAATSGNTDTSFHRNEVHDPSYCSVVLPPPQPMANTLKLAQRCFIVCKPHPPPVQVLQDVFKRFGDLIDVSTFPNKTFGFVKYASVRAAQEAMKTLNGAVVCGVRLKVLEANEAPGKDDMQVDDDSENDDNRKRRRLSDNDVKH